MKFGLLGASLKHSFSQSYFTQKFEREQLNHSYQNIEVPNPTDFKLVEALTELDGFNVTIPYKQAIIPFLSQLSPEAQSVGAVNCVKKVNNEWHGYNTDVIGFKRSLLPLIENKVETALILGTGGASLAVKYVLDQLGIRNFYVSRKPTASHICSYEQLTPLLVSKCHLIVNTTPVGQFPNTDDCPNIPYEAITSSHICFDLIYNPEKTSFLSRAEAHGATICNGKNMLEIQAEESWRIWSEA
jgi:shikimate dehydrogenase